MTFRLADSIPRTKIEQWRSERARWLDAHPLPHDRETTAEYWRLFSRRFHEWLDAGFGSCALRTQAANACMEQVLKYHDGTRYALGAHVVMPNHVHAVITVAMGEDLSRILKSWKSFSAREINRLLGRRGSLWQKESFDHIVRDARALARVEAYIELNRSSLARGACAGGDVDAERAAREKPGERE